MYEQLIDNFIHQEKLPDTYRVGAERFLLPLAASLSAAVSSGSDSTRIIGINGAQGTGKSTLALFLTRVLQHDGLVVANLSIDDFYLTHAERKQLAKTQHPLLRSRGVPGTHDTTLLRTTLRALTEASEGARVSLPRFDKAVDDRLPNQDWPEVSGPADIILLEGWFIGLAPQCSQALAEPINELERQEDADGRWRHWVNERLAQDYQDVFAGLDRLLLLKAPSFEQVYEWRNLQEEKLRQRQTGGAAPGIMEAAALRRFIQHFERLTRHCLDSLPQQADVVLELDAEHRLKSMTNKADQVSGRRPDSSTESLEPP